MLDIEIDFVISYQLSVIGFQAGNRKKGTCHFPMSNLITNN